MGLDIRNADGTSTTLKTALDGGEHVLSVHEPTQVTIQRAVISASNSGDNTIVAATAGEKIKVLGMMLVASGDVSIRFESGAGGTALTGVMDLGAAGNGFILPVSRPGWHWMETAVGALLNLELSTATQVSGFIIYYKEA